VSPFGRDRDDIMTPVNVASELAVVMNPRDDRHPASVRLPTAGSQTGDLSYLTIVAGILGLRARIRVARG
jgi:hypothetical protein